MIQQFKGGLETMRKVTWKKVDDVFIAECEGHMAQSKTLIIATNKAERKAAEAAKAKKEEKKR